MLEGGDRRGLRRVDAWEEETRAGRGRVSLGREVSQGRKVSGERRGGRWEAGLGPEDPRLAMWSLAVQVASWAWPLDRGQTRDGGSETGLSCPHQELCLRA